MVTSAARRWGAWQRLGIMVMVILLAVGTVIYFNPGWYSQAAQHLYVRKNVKDLTPAEKQAYVSAILKAKRTPDPNHPGLSYYDAFVKTHLDAFACNLGWNQGNNWAAAAHNSPTFLAWHRELLSKFETMLRTVSGNPSITIPYWDWTDPASTKAVFAPDFMGGNGIASQGYAVLNGPFRKGAWKITVTDSPAALASQGDNLAPVKPYLVRHFGAFAGKTISLPTLAQVVGAVHVHGYDTAPYNAQSKITQSVRNTLEGWRQAVPSTCVQGYLQQNSAPGAPHDLHNAVHLYVGGVWKQGASILQGTMTFDTSPNDPVFWLHHANVDRLWAAQEMADKESYSPQSGAKVGWNGSDTMWPWHDRTINSWLSTIENGYMYESLSSGP